MSWICRSAYLLVYLPFVRMITWGFGIFLPRLWLEKGDILSVVRHCKACEDDIAPEIIYTYPLALILSGETTKAKSLLKEAEMQLPLVAKELRKKRHPRPKSIMPGYISYGGADQAYEYWVEYGKYWINSEKAMALLSEK